MLAKGAVGTVADGETIGVRYVATVFGVPAISNPTDDGK